MSTKPRTKARCQALYDNGRRCRRLAVCRIDYHGNPEFYGFYPDEPVPTWVRVWLCDQHSRPKEDDRG